jgi:hypothetical protein
MRKKKTSKRKERKRTMRPKKKNTKKKKKKKKTWKKRKREENLWRCKLDCKHKDDNSMLFTFDKLEIMLMKLWITHLVIMLT